MNVEIYDQYATLLNAEGTKFKAGPGSTVIKGENLFLEDAKVLVNQLYQESKTLGSSYEDIIIQLDRGYAELKILFADKTENNRLVRVIYVTE